MQYERNDDLYSRERQKLAAQQTLLKALSTPSEVTLAELHQLIAYQEKYLQDEGSILLRNGRSNAVPQIFLNIWQRAKELGVDYHVPDHIDMSVLFEPDPNNIQKNTITREDPPAQDLQR